MPGPDIFISYCRQDRPAARHFAESFADEGFDVWWDAVMHSGETFDEVIERNLRAAKAVVVLWSPRSVSSRWVRAEATQADRANKLVPVKIEACELPIIFELTHTADLPDWQGDRSDPSWKSLISDLRRLTGPAKAAEEAPAKEAKAPVETAPEPQPEPAPPAARTGNGSKRPSQAEIIEALERIASPKQPSLHQPTPAEQAQAEFFRRSDEYREGEAELVHCLRRVHAPDSEPLHSVGPNGLTIGRTAPADVIVHEPGVSRAHCMVELAADKLRVTDLNSTNGTYIDDRRIGRAELLPVGSILRVGNVSFEHELHSREESNWDGAGLGHARSPQPSRVARSS